MAFLGIVDFGVRRVSSFWLLESMVLYNATATRRVISGGCDDDDDDGMKLGSPFEGDVVRSLRREFLFKRESNFGEEAEDQQFPEHLEIIVRATCGQEWLNREYQYYVVHSTGC